MGIEHFPLMIAGHSGTSTGQTEVTSPFTDEVIGTVAQANKADIELALDTAYSLFRDRQQWLSAPERITILENAVAIMKEEADDLAIGAAAEGGKPLIDSQVEIVRCIDSIRSCIDGLRSEAPATIPMGINAASQHRLTMVRKEPIGVVVSVSAFNHPLNLIAHQVGPAIATGCPVIVKPADDTPLSCFRLVDIFYRAGLPKAWCQAVLTEDIPTSEALVTDPRVGFLSFIGSAKVGWHLRSQLAPGTRCALEHGGVAPVIVDDNCNIEALIPSIAKGGFYHAGQVCVSVQRVFAHQAVAVELANKLATAANNQVVGDPLSAKTEVGPIIRKRELDRIDSWVQEAIAEGAELLCGGKKLANNCYAPTVLLNPSADSKVSKLEIFGPVVCVYSYNDVNQAIALANSLPFAFQASVFSQNIDNAMHIASQLDASAVMINEHTAFRVDWMPFAGLKQSGLGTGGIPYTLEDMQIDKMIVLTSKSIP